MPSWAFHFHVITLQIHWCLEYKANISSGVWCWGSGPTCECWFCLWGTWDWPHPGLRCCWSVCFHHWWQLWWQARGRKGFSPAESNQRTEVTSPRVMKEGFLPYKKKKRETSCLYPRLTSVFLPAPPCNLSWPRHVTLMKWNWNSSCISHSASALWDLLRGHGAEKKKPLQTSQSSVSKRSAQLKPSLQRMLRAGPDLDTLVLSTKQQSSQTQQDVAFTHSNTTGGSHGNLPLFQAAMQCYNYESTWTQHNFNLMLILNTCNIHKVKINFFFFTIPACYLHWHDILVPVWWWTFSITLK